MPLVNLRKIRPQMRSRRLDTLRRVRIMGRAYITFIRAPSKTDLERYLSEYAQITCCLFIKLGVRYWRQWGCRRELLPRYKTAICRRRPSLPGVTDWKQRYRDKCIGRELRTILSHAYLWCICH